VLTVTGSQVSANSATGLGGGILEDGVNPDDSLGQPGGPLALQLTQVTGNSAGEGGGIFASTGSPVTLSLSQVLSNNPDNCAPPGHHPRLHRLAGSPRQPAGRHDRDGPPGISAETLVALTAATASMPGYRPSSPAAPRLSSGTNRRDPSWISPCALSWHCLPVRHDGARRRSPRRRPPR
jgi:hypothetical protein